MCIERMEKRWRALANTTAARILYQHRERILTVGYDWIVKNGIAL